VDAFGTAIVRFTLTPEAAADMAREIRETGSARRGCPAMGDPSGSTA